MVYNGNTLHYLVYHGRVGYLSLASKESSFPTDGIYMKTLSVKFLSD